MNKEIFIDQENLKKERILTQEISPLRIEDVHADVAHNVQDFISEGIHGLAKLEARAADDGLAIDTVDKDQLTVLHREAVEEQRKFTDRLQNREDVRSFSKRYASFRRSEVAAQIWELRRGVRQKKHHAIEENENIARKKKMSNKELRSIKEKIEQIEQAIKDFDISIQKQKSSLWYRFTSLFAQKKLDDEVMRDVAYEKLALAQQEKNEKEQMIHDLTEVIFDSVFLADGKKILKDFYAEQYDLKEHLDAEAEARDVYNITLKKETLFVHGLPLENDTMNNTSANNDVINTKQASVVSKLKLFLGLEPTISVSTVNEKSKYGKGMMYPFGVILHGGRVLSAYRGDAATKTMGLYARMSKIDGTLQKSIIQEDIVARIDDAIDNASTGSGELGGMSDQGFNEFVVEDPKAKMLYIDLDNNGSKVVDLSYVKMISDQLQLPVVGLKNGKYYDLINGGKEMTLADVMELRHDLTVEERCALAESVVEDLFISNKTHKIPTEIKVKLNILRGDENFDTSVTKKPAEFSQSLNLLNAKMINFRGGNLSYWAGNIFSKSDNANGSDLIETAKSDGLSQFAIEEIEKLFKGKSRAECKQILQKCKSDKNHLETLINVKENHGITL